MKVYFDQIFAVTAPGLEQVCAEELQHVTGADMSIEPGGVRFSGGLRELYLANLSSRIASRFLVHVGEIRARDFSAFYKKCVQLPWGALSEGGDAGCDQGVESKFPIGSYRAVGGDNRKGD
jgi:putative N6-adenine-specific DNA methylase